MVWSNSFPNPLTVGGNGQAGSIELYDASGNLLGYWYPNEFTIQNLSGSQISIEPNGAVDGGWPAITFKAGVTDDYGSLYGADDGNGNTAVLLKGGDFTSPSGSALQPLLYLHSDFIELGFATPVGSAHGFEEAFLRLDDTAIYLTYYDSTGSVVYSCKLDAGGFQRYGASWQNIVFYNGWGGFGGAYFAPQYKLTADNMVSLRGLLKPGTTTDGSIIGLLPASTAPTHTLYLSCACSVAGARVTIQPDTSIAGYAATIKCYGVVGASFLSLDTIRYTLDA